MRMRTLMRINLMTVRAKMKKMRVKRIKKTKKIEKVI